MHRQDLKINAMRINMPIRIWGVFLVLARIIKNGESATKYWVIQGEFIGERVLPP